MTTPNDEPHRAPEQPYDDEEDRLANQAGSYDEARRWLGTAEVHVAEWQAAQANEDKPKPKKPLSAAERRRSARAAVGPQYGEEAGVGYPGGKPPEHQDFEPLSPEQAARNRYYSQNWRKVGDLAIRNGTHAVDDGEPSSKQ